LFYDKNGSSQIVNTSTVMHGDLVVMCTSANRLCAQGLEQNSTVLSSNNNVTH